MTARHLLSLLGGLLLAQLARAADVAPFDLAGPHLTVTVTRGAQTLPIAQVPNLAVGDRVAIRADLPASQSAHYLLVAAFLRGATNPPPSSWFFRCETWSAPCAQQGMTVTVPADAQQLLLFLAPETGGDFRTLMSAVRGRPGAFVRTSQDLNQAALDRSRLTAYLGAIGSLAESDAGRLRDAAPLLARSLAIRVDEKCLDRITELQAPCLMQGRESLILNDGHSTSIVEALTSAPASDLAMEASYTPQLSYGYYSPYVASVLDIARILESFHTAQYQYIPALASQEQGAEIGLSLNAAPSFHNPKSVLVAALPAIEPSRPPPLHAVDPNEIYCAHKSSLVLPVEGAPLVFSTAYAHGVRLTLTGADGRSIELPASVDAERGGFVIDTDGLGDTGLGDSVTGSLHGSWGFDAYQGPRFRLINARSQHWSVADSETAALIVGRDATVHLTAARVGCIDGLMLRDPGGKEIKAEWKAVRPNELEVKLPLKDARPGAMTLLVSQYGAHDPQTVALQAFAEAGRFERFTLHAGDAEGVVHGSRLDEISSLLLQGVSFKPAALATRDGSDELTLEAMDAAAAAALSAGAATSARVTLKDGRVLDLPAIILGPRPSAQLLGKSVQTSDSAIDSNIQLEGGDELPQDAQLTFSLRARVPSEFARDEKIEVATVSGSASTVLSLGNGVTLEDAHVAVATLDPLKSFGGSAFGPLHYRVLSGGAASDWQPLATLVRLPVLKRLECPATPELACKLSGSNLFLVDAVASDRDFAHAVRVPDGFPGAALPVPHPTGGQLYVRLRDDPAVVSPAVIAESRLAPSAQEAALAVVRHAAASPPPAAEGTSAHTDPPVGTSAAPTVTAAPAVTTPPPVTAPTTPGAAGSADSHSAASAESHSG